MDELDENEEGVENKFLDESLQGRVSFDAVSGMTDVTVDTYFLFFNPLGILRLFFGFKFTKDVICDGFLYFKFFNFVKSFFKMRLLGVSLILFELDGSKKKTYFLI
jgi:hypothetical protein